ncbi:MAG: translesion DNA synthesis-associated protein ImuA [Nevskiaceae bacterium]
MHAAVAELVRSQPGLWLGSGYAQIKAEATGWAELDRMLPGGGWPAGALTELFCPIEGIGEFSLLMPLIVRLTASGKRVVLVSPPHVPYSQALASCGVKLDKLVLLSPQSTRDTLWAAEQTLRCAAVGLLVAWPQRAGDRELRRLVLAAETSGATAILYRPAREMRSFSPAALRMLVQPAGTSSLQLEIIKSRGGHAAITKLRTPGITAAGRA